MQNILFLNRKTTSKAKVKRLSNHAIQIITDAAINTSGFHLLNNAGNVYGKFEDYTTLYREISGGFILSNDGSEKSYDCGSSVMRVLRPLTLFSVGGLLYALIEMIWRGYSHWTMFLVGGICFVLIGLINEVILWNMPLLIQMLIGMVIITAVEFLSGCIINIWLGWNVWDYSEIPFNLLGQICLPFTVLWFFLSAPGIILDDYLRYWWFDEEKPRYTIWKRGGGS